MASPLFRQEVLHAHQTQWLGTIRLGSPIGHSVVTACALLLASALFLFATLGQATRKARLPGLLMPALGTLNVASPQPGVLIALNVKEGDIVAAGQEVATVLTDRATKDGNLTELVGRALDDRRSALETERELIKRQARERTSALEERLHSLEADIRHAESELEVTQRRLRLAAKSMERYQQLMNEGFVSDLSVQQRQEEWLDIQARERGAQRALASVTREAAAVRAEISAGATSAQSQLVQVERAFASLAQEGSENMARGRSIIVAPQDALVSAVSSNAGQAVNGGQTLLTLVPRKDKRSSELEAQLYAPSRTAGFVQAGQQVWLRLAAYPYQKFGMALGEITSVSRTPINPQDLPQGQMQALAQAAQSAEPLYRISVALRSQHMVVYGKPQPLKAGMSLDADVIQDRRAVWEWILEPVLAASGTALALGSAPGLTGQGS